MSNRPEIDHRSKDEVVKQFREDTLTDAARKLIAQEGFAGLTIERVAELAGVSKGTIYLYFKNKEDLVRATIANTVALLIHEGTLATQPAAGFEAKLEALIGAQLQLVEANQAFFRALLGSQQARPDTTDARLLNRQYEYARFIAGLVDSGKAEGVLRPSLDSLEVAFHIIYILQAASMRHLLGLSSRPLGDPAEVDAILDLLIHGIGA